MIKTIVQAYRASLCNKIVVHALYLLTAVAIFVGNKRINVIRRLFRCMRIKLEAAINDIDVVFMLKLC
ncbi:hypothetical protein D3C73_1242310 [compost metagenome]